MLRHYQNANPFVLYGLFFFVVIAVAGIFLSITSQWEQTQANAAKPGVGENAEEFNSKEMDLIDPQTPSMVPDAVGKRNEIASRWRERAEELNEERKSLEQLASLLRSRFAELMGDSVGKRISSSPDLVDRFVLCEDEFQTSYAELPDVLSSMEILHLKLVEAANSPNSSELRFATETSDIRKQSIALRAKFDDQKFRLDRIVSSANQLQLSDTTLQEAISLQRASEEESRIHVFKDLQKQEMEKRLAEQAAIAKEKEEAEYQLRKQQELSKIEELKAQAEADKKRSELAIQKQQLEVEFERDLPKIQHYLGVLFKHAPRQIVRGSVVGVKDSGPVSLAGLRSLGGGGLGNDYQKATQGLLLFFSYYEAGGRGSGPYPARYAGGYLDSDKEDAIRPAYLLLEKYGDLLVEKGMLAP
ncbi:MAG: hypothetical protein J0M26_06405 [Planctomycetes bacterium]|nr:hypothetical protein [Planctomycetota bacterium]